MVGLRKEYPVIPRVACVNGLILKIIAVVSMLCDHVGYVLFPQIDAFRIIGRLAFPIFVFLLVEGFVNTRDVRKYELRLLVFALVSEIPYDLAFYDTFPVWQDQNVFFTLFLGLLLIDVVKTIHERLDSPAGKMILEFLFLLGFVVLGYLLHTDYAGLGVFLIYAFWRLREELVLKFFLLAVVAFLWAGVIEGIMDETWCLLSIIFLLLYNGQRGFGRQRGIYAGQRRGAPYQLSRYAFYLVYPVHLLALYFIYQAVR